MALVQKKDCQSTGFGEWVSSVDVQVNENGNGGIGDYDLRTINVESGEVKPTWMYTFNGFALDPKTGSFAICGGDHNPLINYSPFGIYLFLPNKPRQYISAKPLV